MIDTTDKTLNQVCLEIFKLLVEQKKQCLDDKNCCMYGNETGEHCAIGFLLPEDNEELMGFGGDLADLLIFDDIGPNTDFIHKNFQALDVMQDAHDFKSDAHIHVKTLKNDFNISNEYLDQWEKL